MVIGDGSSTSALLNPGTGNPAGKVMDIVACDANTDADPDPAVCAVAYEEPLERAPMVGAPAILPDGTFIFWEFGLDFAAPDDARDIAAYGPDGMVWEAALPDGLDWTSVITVTDNHLLGTASRVEPSSEQFLGLTFPRVTHDVVVVMDRTDGELVWQHELPDDGTATVTIDKDGAIYVGVMGFLSILATEERPDLGLLKFEPRGI